MTPPIFHHRRWLFAFKTFAAAMIAYTVAVHIGLSQPYWAIVTAVVVMDPFTGAIRSKAVYRFVGTVAAGIIGLTLAGLFANTSLLLIISTGIVSAVLFGIGWMDRSPRAYGFRLCGLTLIIVIVPEISHPDAMFSHAIARVCEIGLGIIACSMVDSIVAPRSIRDSTEDKLRKMVSDGLEWFDDVLHNPEGSSVSSQDRMRMIGEATDLSMLGASLRYDPTVPRRDRKIAFAIQQRLLRLIPLVSAVEDRLSNLDSDHIDHLRPYLEEACRLLANGQYPPANFMATAIRDLEPEDVTWAFMTERNIARIITETLIRAAELKALQSALGTTRNLSPELEQEVSKTRQFPLLPDIHTAWGVGVSVLLTYGALALIWYLTAWPQAATAILIGCVSLAFMGGLDQAGMAIISFATTALLSAVLGGILYFGLLPMATEYGAFLLAMALFIMPLAAWAISNRGAILIIAMALSVLQLQGSYIQIGFDTYFEGSFASFVGLFTAYYSVVLLRQLGAHHVVTRFTRQFRRDIASLTRHASQHDRDLYVARAIDRIGALTSRMTAIDSEKESALLMTRLRAGANIADLRFAIDRYSGEIRNKVEQIFDHIRGEINDTTASPELLSRIDQALTAAVYGPASKDPHVMRGLIGLRFALFRTSPPWRPVS
ncbi:FUSC family protein [Altericroceibacterium spongiae]|uniref:FUSC family protein n=1 Tax=Altericroceibacterium spongiae TaxID=2320269 RepID=A0A420ECF0_9SPHN|nr:FUSC family protein [Altericroceibacterium spongiae]RKF18333.1 FUSC family protein [Altericroceibacterium spongiae]